MNSIGLYIDIPFCIARCAFCAFNIQGYQEERAQSYITALQKELSLYRDTLNERIITSIYVGGGTPSLYPAEILTGLLEAIFNQCQLTKDAEITLEAHPAAVDLEKLITLRQSGFNRLSLGIQSFSDQQLMALNRHHTVYDAKKSYAAARAAGFTNIGIDLIYGLPEETISAWEQTVDAAISLQPNHLSLYALSIEEGTLFHKKYKAGELSLPTEEEIIDQYRLAQKKLKAAGILQYELSNFGSPCRHNLLYWDRKEVLGIGLSAHSYVDKKSWANTDSLKIYLEKLKNGELPISEMETETDMMIRKDQIIFGLRKSEGISRSFVIEDENHHQIMETLIEEGLLIAFEDRLSLTARGELLADEVAIAFM